MKALFHTTGENYRKLKEIFLADEEINRASISSKEATQFGFDSGYVILVEGDEKRTNKAIEIAIKEEENKKPYAKEIKGEKKEEILKQIKSEEDKAIEGFGGIFG